MIKQPDFESIPSNFGGLPSDVSQYSTSRVVILPVPYDATTSYLAGTRHGPAAIISASQNMEFFDEELCEDLSEIGICTMNPLAPLKNSPASMVDRIRALIGQLLADGKFVLSLGGEHSITPPCVAAYHEHFKDLTVLQVDAHLDLRDSYEGTPHSHASAMRRVDEFCPHVAVGIRSFSREEYDYLSETGFEPFTMQVIRSMPDWIDRVCDRLSQHVYLSIDLDGFDPSVIPGVGTPEPGGLCWPEVTRLLHQISKRCTIVGADIVELLPIPGQVVSEFAAARLALKVIAFARHSGAFAGNQT